jgi:hypothetical protein
MVGRVQGLTGGSPSQILGLTAATVVGWLVGLWLTGSDTLLGPLVFVAFVVPIATVPAALAGRYSRWRFATYLLVFFLTLFVLTTGGSLLAGGMTVGDIEPRLRFFVVPTLFTVGGYFAVIKAVAR